MSKFPGDVEMAEKLTGGDPDIISSNKFTRQKKPDISALFGEKKLPKKKRDRDDNSRERRHDSGSSSDTPSRKITHPRFLKDSDHEVRIRHQPSSLSSTPTNSAGGSPQYTCYICNFTSARLNVIVLHNKTHSSGGKTPPVKTKVKTHLQPKPKASSESETPKRKYTKKDKGESNRPRKEIATDAVKRKYTKQSEKANKKKKPDPELREKLLADWEDESDDEMEVEFNKTAGTTSIEDPPEMSQINSGNTEASEPVDNENVLDENDKILSEAERILKETESLPALALSPDSLGPKTKKSKHFLSELSSPAKGEKEKKSNAKFSALDKDDKKLDSETDDKVSGSDKGDKKTGSENDDKKSRFSCFDFDEEDIAEPTIPPVRKIPRVFGDKNLSLKKEIIKKFELSQALKNDQQNDAKNDNDSSAAAAKEDSLEYPQAVNESETRVEKIGANMSKTELEIVEIFEIEKEEEEEDSQFDETSFTTKTEIITEQIEIPMEINDEKKDSNKQAETVSEKIESAVGQSKLLDLETASTDTDKSQSATTADEIEPESTPMEVCEMSPVSVKRRRGRPRKTIPVDKKIVKHIEPAENDSMLVETAVIEVEPVNKPVELIQDPIVTVKKSEDDAKTVDSDLETSQFGRKRRSGRKSSKSEPPHVDNKTSNDDSQSEIDDRSFSVEEKPAEPKKKGKRGRKPSGYGKKLSSVAEKPVESDDKLLELLEKRNDSISEDENLVKDTEECKIDEQTTERDKKSDEANEEPLENFGETISVEETVPETHVELLDQSRDLTSTTEPDAPQETEADKELPSVEEKPAEPESSSITPVVSESSQAETESLYTAIENNLIEEEVITEESKIEEETVIETIIEEEIIISETVEADTVALETLPPKKSQKKKFELSQTDFFENDASIEKSVIPPEPEKKIDKPEEMEIEITRVDPNEEIVHTFPEKVVVEEETVDIRQEGTDSTDFISVIEEEVVSSEVVTEKEKSDDNLEVTIERDGNGEVEPQESDHRAEGESKVEQTVQKVDQNELEIELVSKEVPKSTSVDVTPAKRSSMQTRYKGKFTPETGAKSKKDKDGSTEEKPVNTFQEAFLKTLQIEDLKSEKKMVIDEIEITVGRGKKGKKSADKKVDVDVDNVNIVPVETVTQETEAESVESKEVIARVEEIVESPSISNVSAVGDFQGIEVVVEGNAETEIKLEEENVKEIHQQIPEAIVEAPVNPAPTAKMEDVTKTLSLDMSRLDESSRASTTSTPSPNSVSGVPVKKREKPRIIESVALTEPVHILKTKPLEKKPARGTKHKLELDTPKRGDSKQSPRAKIMKIENLPSNSKLRQSLKLTSPHLSLTKKLEALKAEEAATASLMESQTEKLTPQTSQTVSSAPLTEKLIQQSSQSLADMELDINSMPFVLSEDVLTPESIEQMPLVITPLIPSSSTVATSTISLTPTTQIVSSSQGQFKTISNESPIETTPSKKKSGVPAILKNKGKAKPTITSVKTIVPPLTPGGIKGLKFQSAQTGKTSQLIPQKGQPGKYVIVQTATGQQVRYSVQGKVGSQQKIAIPTGKGAGSAQVVHQGGKVVILTSPQSGQTKMIPLNTSKALGTKMQRIVTSKGQIFAPINTQGGVLSTKTIIAPKTDGGSPTTSKGTPQGQKIISAQGLSTKTGMYTPIPSTIPKSMLPGLFQGILTKSGIYTPISAASLTGKTIISSKTLVTSKGTTVLSPLTSQGLVTSKGTILAPISQSMSGKTVLSQGIVGSKGTVLTPITGQQVKAIAAKSPAKGPKIQYQTVQQKVQLPVMQKGQKVPISSAQMRVLGSLQSPGSTILLQNTVTGKKTFLTGKRVIKQTQPLPALTAQSGSQQGSPVLSHGQNTKGKIISTTQTIQKLVMPRTQGRQQKSQQKIVVQKIHEPLIQASSSKLGGTNVTSVSKAVTQSKQIAGSSAHATKGSAKSYTGVKGGQQRRNLLNVALNSIASPQIPASTITKPLPLPPLEQIQTEKKIKVEETVEEVIPKEEPKSEPSTVEHSTPIPEKVEEPKVATQPQIMALPTESADGSQTYVLVTIDDQGQIHPLDNNALMSLEGTTQNADGTRTLYLDPSSLGEAGNMDNIVVQYDNGSVLNLSSAAGELSQTMISESFPSSEIVPTSNQDILAAALANTDFQQEIGLSDHSTASVMSTGITQTSLINQTILQSTIIPPTEPISSPAVLETSLTLNQPIMTPLEVPSSLTTAASTSVVPTISSSLELPLTVTNPSIAYISTGAAQIQIPGNSMPDIGEILESSAVVSHSETPVTTQYLVLPNLDESITIEAQNIQTDSNSVPTVSYSVSIPENMVLETTPVQTTPSMPIIDDSFADDVPYSTSIETPMVGDQSFVDVPVSEMLVSKAKVENTAAQNVTVTSEMIVSSHEAAVSSEELVTTESTPSSKEVEVSLSSQDIYTSHEVPVTTEELITTVTTHDMPIVVQAEANQEITIENDDLHSMQMQIEEHTTEIEATSMPLIEETCTVTSESTTQVTDSSEIQASTSYDIVPARKLDQLLESSTADEKPCSVDDVAVSTNEDSQNVRDEATESLDNTEAEHMEVEASIDTDSQEDSKEHVPEASQAETATVEGEQSREIIGADSEINFEEAVPETSEETPSQSYEQFDIAMGSDSLEIPSQSVNKSENSPEPTQSISYESMEVDDNNTSAEPPTQSFEDSKQSEATQSYETSVEIHGNAPTQSFNEIMHNQEDRNSSDELVDDQSFPTQSYEVGKLESLSESMETDAEMSQEGNIPSQSNDIGTDGIGTSSIFTNNSGANEDETASSSYVPETPENQERDQDQESAISTSSYEIPPCEELNIASSSVIPDTSVRGEHTSIHDNGVLEIPTSSYNLNPDSSSTHVDAVPTSSYEDQVILEQNVSTSYEVPISMPGLEENSSQSFVTESSDHRNEPTSYYTHSQEVTASYYDSVHQESNSRLEEDPQEEVTASYYESTPQDIASEASQSYFTPEEATPSYSTPSYYNRRPESEATQSFYSSQALDRREQSSSQNVEASQSFYPEANENLRLRQQGEATPTYSGRYPVDYTLTDSPIERHDLVESSVPATRPAER